MSTLRTTTLKHGSSTIDNIVFDNQGRSTFGGNALFVNAQNQRVGVNTTNPTVALDVDGAINATGNVVFGGQLNLTGNLTVDTNTLVVDATNNRVGIGIAAPTTMLDVDGTISGHNYYIDVDAGTVGIQNETSIEMFGQNSINLMLFRVDGTETARILANGRVGIGTAAPGKRLDVRSDSQYEGIQVSNTSGQPVVQIIGFDADGDGGGLALWDGGAKSAQILSNNNSFFNGGNVGIGTGSPARPLTVSFPLGSSNAIRQGIDSTQYLESYYNGGANYQKARNGNSQGKFIWESTDGSTNNERMRIEASGNVGIGTTSPAAKLHINSSGSNYLIIQGGSSSPTGVLFGDAQNSNIGQILYYNSSNSMSFLTNASEAIRIDSAGRLLVGTSSGVDSSTNVNSQFQVHSGQGPAMFGRFRDDSTASALYLVKSRNTTVGEQTIVIDDDNIGRIAFEASDGTQLQRAAIIDAYVDGTPGVADMPGRLVFSTTADGASSPTERMRIRNNGNVQFNYTGSNLPGSNNTDVGAVFERVSDGATLFISRTNNIAGRFNRNSDGDVHDFRRSGNSVGSISVTTSATSYNTSSDYRLKENVVPMTGASDRVKALKPCRFNFKAEADKTVDGFLAHEAQEVVPEAVTGEKDGEEMQAIDTSKLVPLLTAALQEALERIKVLEQRVLE